MFVALLADVDKGDLDEVGGKGANLGELYRVGLPVPPGFTITTTGYRRFVEANDFQEQIMALATKSQAGDPAAYEAAATQIRDLFVAGTMPDAPADAIRTAYTNLMDESISGRETAVAVRSSATAEDLPTTQRFPAPELVQATAPGQVESADVA